MLGVQAGLANLGNNSLNRRLVGKGTRHDIELKKELVYNAPAIAQNSIMCAIALKVKDNV